MSIAKLSADIRVTPETANRLARLAYSPSDPRDAREVIAEMVARWVEREEADRWARADRAPGER